MNTSPPAPYPPIDPDAELLRPAAACRVMDISRPTLYRLLASGELDSVLIGERSRRIPRAAIRDYIERRRSRAGA